MEPLALALLIVLAVVALLRTPRDYAPALITEGGAQGTLPPPTDDDEELPQTDRAPRPPRWLPLTVASVAALRLALLVTLHA